jgi:hypothetical protein
MLLAGKAACAGIAFILLATGISGPRPTPLASGPTAAKKCQRSRIGTMSRRCSKLCRTKDTTAEWSMACSVSEPGRAFADFRS